MRKFKFFANFDKEEQWLNEMAKQGYSLTSKMFGYKFQRSTPDDAVIKVDYRQFNRCANYHDYVALFRDSGWEHIAGSKSSGAQYFKKTEKATSEDIFSDKNSKAGRYKRMSDMWFMLAACYIPIFVALFNTGAINAKVLTDPKKLYYTPELWEQQGADFWRAFLFETPFALFRGFLWLVFPAMIVLSLFYAINASKQYKKTKISG